MNGDAECGTGVGHTHTHIDRHPPTRAKEEHKRFMLKIWRRGKTHTHTGSASGEKTERKERNIYRQFSGGMTETTREDK